MKKLTILFIFTAFLASNGYAQENIAAEIEEKEREMHEQAERAEAERRNHEMEEQIRNVRDSVSGVTRF